MAQLVTWDEFPSSGAPKGGTIREIVFAEVVNVISKRRPLMSMLGNQNVDVLFVERLEDTLASRGHNAVQEGASHTSPSLTQPSRLVYHVQRFADWGEVADEQRDVAHYNGDPFAYHISKNLQELMNDVEHALHRGSAITGASGTARQLLGLLNMFVNEPTWTADASGTTFTEKVFIDILQSFRDQNFDVNPDTVLVNSWLKRSISEFSTKITRNIDASERLQQLVVERHSSDFGDVDVFYTEDQLLGDSVTEQGNSAVVIDRQFFEKGWFKAPTVEPLSRQGFSTRFQATAQCTLLYKTLRAGGGGVGYVPNITLD
jgi:hypothetical protein